MTHSHPFFAPSDIYARLQAGHADDAERMARHNLARLPDDEGAQLLLAMALQNLKRRDEAILAYTRLTQQFPASKDHWANLGTILREAGHLEESQSAYATALTLAPDDPQTHYNLGLLLMERDLYSRARQEFIDVVNTQPDFAEARVYGAMMCYECGDNPTAERMLEPWREWNDLGDEVRVDLGWLLIQLGRVEDGEEQLRETLDNAYERPRVIALLVQLRERVNRMDEARVLAAELPAPDTIDDHAIRNEVISALAVLATRGTDLKHARALLQQLLDLTDSERKRSNIYFSLGHVCDKLGDYPAAFSAFQRAHASQLLTAGEVVPELLDPAMEPLRISTYLIAAERHAQWHQFDGPPAAQSPVFVVGFPRSGTTMLEQMLDAHPSMRAMDERAFLQGVIERMQGFGLSYPEQVGELDEKHIAILRERYWKLVSNVVTLEPGQRLVDKNPLNMLRLPMINRLFPHAKVILCLRHPCDVLMSCYMQSFRSPNFAILCSSLERLARGYVNAMRSWIHHAELLKPDTLLWRYEEALEDFGMQVKRAGDFLELEDSAPLAHFHEHARAKGFISTPSYHQVVEPINKKALGRWRRYEEHFGPALQILAPIMQHWNYDV
jgi:tetratricopeptide (TPR) repeat protein